KCEQLTRTLEETKAVVSREELEASILRYYIGEVGEMHHNPYKNVLHARVPVEELAERMKKKKPEQVQALVDSAKTKMYAARKQRPTPYVDKTIYVGWNALCISAYLHAAQALQ